MSSALRRTILLVLVAATSAWGQFNLYLVSGGLETPVGRAYDCGTVEPGASLALPFRIRNTSTSPAKLDLLTVSGAGFSFSAPTSLPLSLDPGQLVDFIVIFQSAGTGSY